MNIDTSNIDDIIGCNNSNFKVMMIPLITTDDVNDLSKWIMYNEGSLCVEYSGSGNLGSSVNTIKILVVVIDTKYQFDITFDLSMCPYYK